MKPLLLEIFIFLKINSSHFYFFDICSFQYPKWLSENEGKLEKSQYDNYVKQSEVMSRICGVFDEEKDGDSAEQKQKRFEKILDLMQQVRLSSLSSRN